MKHETPSGESEKGPQTPLPLGQEGARQSLLPEYLAAIFQQSMIGVAISDLVTGRYLQANARFSEIVGYPLEELLQRTFQSITHPKDLAQGLELREALRADRLREYHFQKRYLRPNGEVVWGSVAISAICTPGQPCERALVILTDITDAKRLEQALQESERQYRELVENANCIILRWDHEGRITFINAYGERFFGYSRQELVGQNVVGTIVPESESTGRDLRSLMEAIIEAPEAFKSNINENICRDGRRVWIEWSNRSVLNEKGRLKEVFSIGWDITARWLAEQSLKERHRQLSQLAEAARQLHRHLEVGAILRFLVETAVKLTGAVGGAAGMLQQERMVFTEYFLNGRWIPIDYQFPAGYGVSGHVMQIRQPYISADAVRDKHVIPEIQQALGFTTLVNIPIFSHEGQLLGCFEMHNKHGGQSFSSTDVELLQILAATAGIALRNAQLFQQAQRELAEREKAEAALRESEERYRALFERSSDAVFLCDFEGRFLDANQSALDLMGYSREEIRELEFRHLLTPDQLPVAFRSVQEIMATGRQETPTEYRLRRKDGSEVIVETQAALIMKEGKPYAIQGIGRDITARRRAEQAEREARQFLQTILDTVPARVFWKDRQSRYLGCNVAFARDAQLSSPAEIVGKTDYELVWKEPAAAYQAVDQEVMATGQPKLRYELALTHPDKSQTWLIVSKTPLRDTHGNIIGVLGTYEDITELKRMEEAHARMQQQFLHAQKLESVGRLAGGVAHDFNNMLQAILGNVELVLQEGGLSGELRESLEEIRRSAERSAALTQQLLGFARRQTIAPRVVDLNEEIGHLLKMLRRLIGEDIQMVWVPGSGVWPVRLDPGQLSQVLANLVVNARDAIGGRAGGRITLETANVVLDATYVERHGEVVAGEYVLVAVSDNGVGMSAEVKEKVFEPFFTTKELGKGTGLGLATVYGIMKQNRGHASVYSEEGQGATIKLYFPRWEGEEGEKGVRGAAAVVGAEALPGARGKEVVMLVEDEEQVLELGRRLLERRGYRVLAARGPGEALALAEGHEGRVDLLVTDVVMPGMNGRELRDRLRGRWPGLKCLFMSGYTANVIAHHGVLEEGVEFMLKPFTAQDFCQRVRQLLDAGADPAGA
ncbi:PAS domain S-box protein [Fontisphaera persica]|uniref:PAS domain S-box protein n=1 Tax=Fontisphaera persica TaxID=2974023 RepID=UPI0024C0A56A|nr:PAS domain S-box protein [Fontisphaera persica]WCJ59785.1 PAS domain S-box protein [Fontisphaera persica]